MAIQASTMTLSEADAYNALMYLVNTDEEAAQAKALYNGLEDSKKSVAAIAFMSVGGSAAERKEKALSSQAYINHIKKIENALLDYETLRNKRSTAALQIEVWRSVNSNRNKGNI